MYFGIDLSKIFQNFVKIGTLSTITEISLEAQQIKFSFDLGMSPTVFLAYLRKILILELSDI